MRPEVVLTLGYAKAPCSERVIVRDARTNEPLAGVIEANSREGWIVRYVAVAPDRYLVMDNVLVTERVELPILIEVRR